MTRRGESITISLSISHQQELEKLALGMDCTWGNKGNISALMRAIAEGKIELRSKSNSTLSSKEKIMLEKAIKILQQIVD